MNKKLLMVLLALSVGICSLPVWNKAQEACAAGNDEPAQVNPGSAEVRPAQQNSVSTAQTDSAAPAGQPVYISISEVFKDLQRPPVKFYHDRHARALEKEGCEECHPKDATGKLMYSFPKQKNIRTAETLMNSYHDRCIGCHNERAAAGKTAGAVTCGECHTVDAGYHSIEYLPRLPEYYEPLRDTYHRDCIACHKDLPKTARDATKLDWKGFYIREKDTIEASWPTVVMDYKLHYQHEQALEKKCELCHRTFCEAEDKMVYVKGSESSCRDCHTDKDQDNRLSYRHLSHNQCIGCHQERSKENKKAGPFYCNDCHTGIERSVEEMAYVPREERNQPQKLLIEIPGARMKGVPFDHRIHELKTTTCQACHHDTLNRCSTCHTQRGSSEGDWVPLAEAYHASTSAWSCVGCHETTKQAPDCAGCHSQMKKELSESSCLTCHSGAPDESRGFIPAPDSAIPGADELSGELVFSLTGYDWMPFQLPLLAAPEALLPDNTREKMEIALLEKSYDPSQLPHLKIVKKLTDISNNNRLSRYFHAGETTLCAGCHHVGPLAVKQTPPLCSACHTSKNSPQKNTPTLLGAYHRQCLGCHKAMGGEEKEKPQSCSGCHKEKPSAPMQTAAR